MERQIETLERGSGFPLLLLHGMMGQAGNWEKVLPNLPAGAHAIAPQFPFFESNDSPKTIPGTCQFVKDFLASRPEIDRMIIAGNSLGGHVALHLAMDMPHRIDGLVLTGSSGLFERQITGSRGANPSREWYREKMQEIFYDPIHVTDELLDGVMGVLESRLAKRHLISIAKSAKRDNLADRLSEVRCPVLLIWGRDDTITPPDVAEEFNALLPNSELAWIDKCGHAAMIERPGQVGRLIGQWWARHFQPLDDDCESPSSL